MQPLPKPTPAAVEAAAPPPDVKKPRKAVGFGARRVDPASTALEQD
jgi:hypothetical protein